MGQHARQGNPRGLFEGGHSDMEQKRDSRGNNWKEGRGMGLELRQKYGEGGVSHRIREEEEATVLIQFLQF